MNEKQNQQEQQQVEHKKGNPPRYRNAMDLRSRRERRNPFRTKYRNDRKPVGTGFLNMGVAWDGQVIYFPKRKKLKGWQKESKRR